MQKPPLPVIAIGCLYIVTGAVGLVHYLSDFKVQHPFPYDAVLASLVSLIAIVAGIYLLRRCNWARWLALAWIAFHVVLSLFHSPFELAVHSVLCVAIAYFLFRPAAARYFGRQA